MYHGACFATTLIHWNIDFMRAKVQRRTIIATHRNLTEKYFSQVSKGLNIPFQSTGSYLIRKTIRKLSIIISIVLEPVKNYHYNSKTMNRAIVPMQVRN